jgi:hypothetical protein
LSTTVLSLLVALFAVLGPSISAIKQAFHRSSANINFVYLSSEFGRISFLLSNDGEISGSIFHGSIVFPDGRRIFLERPGQSDTILLGPGATASAEFVSMNAVANPPKDNQTCKIQFVIVGTNETSQFLERPIMCMLLSGIWAK